MEEYVVVLITVPSTEVGRGLARALLEAKLAACVNIVSGVNSLYTWEGEIYDEEEVLLIVKTRAGLLDAELIPVVEELHPYKVPEIIALPIVKGSRNYLEWIEEATA